METLQLLPLCFLLLSTPYVDVQTQFLDFKCDENMTAEIGKNIDITCISNAKITDMTVKFCTNKTLCSNSSNINTFKNITTVDIGRIALEINVNSTTLHISNVQISDQKMYQFFASSPIGHRNKDVLVWVIGPVPPTSERPITEIPVLEKFRSEDTLSNEIKYTAFILVPMAMLAIAMALFWRKKKVGYVIWQKIPDVYHQPRFPEDSL
uniref:Uncharacterized protein n=1 Tax=Sphaerodactylus townsendi TaxID=933632 RepID=A0ACB8EJR3_9SAUR